MRDGNQPLQFLILEDSRFDAELLREFLRRNYPGALHEVVSTEDAFIMAIDSGRFDIVLSDYELPLYSGDQALRYTRTASADMPFIFVSGVIGEENAVEMLKRGATDYVSKNRLERLPIVIERALREITEREARNRAERQLREADAVFARIVDALRDYAIMLLDTDGRIQSWNSGARAIFGYDQADVHGRSAAMLFTSKDLHDGVFDKEMRTALATGKTNDTRWLQRADGTLLWAEGILMSLHDDSGAHKGFSKIVHDRTAAYRDAEALRLAKEEAERANRAKDRFLAVLSHELRTPLTPIASAAHVLERHASVPDKYRNLLPMIQRNVALEARLIADMLDLSAISAGKLNLRFGAVDMHEVVHFVLEMLGEQIREQKLQLTLELHAVNAFVKADEARMQQVVWNILRNAVKFTPAGGNITIHTDSDDTRFTLSCSDSGIGIEAAALPRIFTAFEQADGEVSQRFGGLGLGLAIARGLVNEHGGELVANSDGRDRGATFTLRLRCLDEAAGIPEVAQAAPAIDGTCSLLLVEDSPDSADAMALCLEAYGYSVTLARNYKDAMTAFSKKPFDVVITDLGLPDGNGIDLGRVLSTKAPVIALSGFGTAQDIERSKLAGFSGHITKPADFSAVHALVQEVLNERSSRPRALS